MVKVMGKHLGEEFEEEAIANQSLPDDNPRLIKAYDTVFASFGMPSYPLFGDGSVLYQYNYLVMPYAKKGSLLDLIQKP